jgi:hypothetical protein
MQQAIDTWEQSLKATCGEIVPEKTVWWLVSFQWTGTSWKYNSINESPGELLVNDIHKDRKKIKRLESYQAHETQGIFLAPDGNTDDQCEKMKQAAIQWAEHMRTRKICRNDAWIAVQSTIWRTLTYALPALNLTQEQCKAIMAPVLRFCLPAIGVCRNFSKKLVFAQMGLGFTHLHSLHKIAWIKDSHTLFKEHLQGTYIGHPWN